MRKQRDVLNAALIYRHKVVVRFSEVDSMQIVWHGNYIKFFEDGREAFGKNYNIGYMDILNAGYTAPIVELQCSYLSPLRYGDIAIVETRYIDLPSAKVKFEYIIYCEQDNRVVAKGSSMQVFLDSEGNLEWNSPQFYLNWKKRWIKNE